MFRLFMTSILFFLISHHVTVFTLDFDTRYAPALYSRSLGSRYTFTDLQPSSRYTRIFTSNNATEKSPRLGSMKLASWPSVVHVALNRAKITKVRDEYLKKVITITSNNFKLFKSRYIIFSISFV